MLGNPSDADSATSQWFVNLTDDNDFLDDDFTVFAKVVEGMDVVQAIERPFYDRSRVIANLKAARRSEHFEFGPFILARTRVGAFEASAARNLVSMGADIALVAGEDGGSTSVTGRVSRRALDAGFHLGKFFQVLAERTGGDGGGHAGAAGFKAPMPVGAVEEQVLELAREVLPSLSDPDRD